MNEIAPTTSGEMRGNKALSGNLDIPGFVRGTINILTIDNTKSAFRLVDMNNVLLHVRSKGSTATENTERTFLRLPVVGEYVATTKDDWCQITLVLHVPFEKEITAELFALKVDRMEVLNAEMKK
jgi:hypothetical protein